MSPDAVRKFVEASPFIPFTGDAEFELIDAFLITTIKTNKRSTAKMAGRPAAR